MGRTDRVCANCEAAWARPRGRLCSACYEYRRRIGRDRPEDLVVAHGRRVLDKRLGLVPQFSRLGRSG